MKYRVSDCVDIISGGTPRKSNELYWNGNIPWITVKDFNDKYVTTITDYITLDGLEHSSVNLTEDQDILISARGTVGKVLMVDAGYTFNQSIFGLRADRSILVPDYLFYWLEKNISLVKQGTHGSVFETITKDTFNHLIIDLPSLEEQNQIAYKLFLLDRKKYLNNQINDNLLELANVIFTNQISKDTTQLSNIATIQNGYAFKSKEYVSQKQLLVLRSKNIGSNHLFNKLDVVYIDQHSFNEYKKFAFKKFDTVLVMVGASIGKTGFITSNVLPALQNQNMWRFRAKNSSMPGLLLYEYINYINKRVKGSASGSARSFYRKKLFSDFEVPIIDNNIFSMFEKIQLQINNIQVENNALSKLKQNLLNKYF